jgi:hypothetical protein
MQTDPNDGPDFHPTSVFEAFHFLERLPPASDALLFRGVLESALLLQISNHAKACTPFQPHDPDVALTPKEEVPTACVHCSLRREWMDQWEFKEHAVRMELQWKQACPRKCDTQWKKTRSGGIGAGLPYLQPILFNVEGRFDTVVVAPTVLDDEDIFMQHPELPSFNAELSSGSHILDSLFECMLSSEVLEQLVVDDYVDEDSDSEDESPADFFDAPHPILGTGASSRASALFIDPDISNTTLPHCNVDLSLAPVDPNIDLAWQQWLPPPPARTFSLSFNPPDGGHVQQQIQQPDEDPDAILSIPKTNLKYSLPHFDILPIGPPVGLAGLTTTLLSIITGMQQEEGGVLLDTPMEEWQEFAQNWNGTFFSSKSVRPVILLDLDGKELPRVNAKPSVEKQLAECCRRLSTAYLTPPCDPNTGVGMPSLWQESYTHELRKRLASIRTHIFEAGMLSLTFDHRQQPKEQPEQALAELAEAGADAKNKQQPAPVRHLANQFVAIQNKASTPVAEISAKKSSSSSSSNVPTRTEGLKSASEPRVQPGIYGLRLPSTSQAFGSRERLESSLKSSVQVFGSERLVERAEGNSSMLEQLQAESIRVIERDETSLMWPVDIVVDERTGICFCNTDALFESVQKYTLGLTKQVWRFKSMHVILMDNFEDTGTSDTKSDLLLSFYASVVNFPIDVQVYVASSVQMASALTRKIVDNSCQRSIQAKFIGLPCEFYHPAHIHERETCHEWFLTKFPYVNPYTAQSLLHKSTLKEILSLFPKELFDRAPQTIRRDTVEGIHKVSICKYAFQNQDD